MEAETQGVVYIVEDDAGMRKSLVMLIESALIEVRAYESAEAFLEDIEPAHSACLVLDLRMPQMSGIELLQKLRTDLNDIPVILISGHADVPATVRAMKLGAVDLLQKPIEPTTLLEAIKRSLSLSRSLHHEQEKAEAVRCRFTGLTAREMELAAYIVEGQLNKQIAIVMGISVKTVANHRASLMAKTGAANAADLARLFTIFQTHSATSRQ